MRPEVSRARHSCPQQAAVSLHLKGEKKKNKEGMVTLRGQDKSFSSFVPEFPGFPSSFLSLYNLSWNRPVEIAYSSRNILFISIDKFILEINISLLFFYFTTENIFIE